MEISIQRAAQAVSEVIGGSRGTPLSAKSASSPQSASPRSGLRAEPPEPADGSSRDKPDDDGELARVTAQHEAALSAAQASLSEMQVQLFSARREISAAAAQLTEERREVSDLRGRLAEEASLRRDLEAELEILMARLASSALSSSSIDNRGGADRPPLVLPAAASVVNDAGGRAVAAEARAAELQSANIDLQARLEKAQRDAASLRRAAHEVTALQRENGHLLRAVKELRKDLPRRTDTSSSRAVASASSHSDHSSSSSSSSHPARTGTSLAAVGPLEHHRSPFPARYQRMCLPCPAFMYTCIP